MFKVHASKAIWTDLDEADLFDHLYRDVELTFPPYVGLSVRQDGWESGPLVRITWDITKQYFHVEAQAAKPFEADEYDFTAEKLRDMDIRYEWTSYRSLKK